MASDTVKEPAQIIAEHAHAGAVLREKFFSANAALIEEAAFQTALSFARGGKLLLCGNGGSAGDAQHVAGEFVNRFLIERPALPAIALTTDTSVMTAIGNDYSFDRVFARQVEALGRPEDTLFAISTSGNSPNVLAALAAASDKKMRIIGLTGKGGGKMAPLCQILIEAPSDKTPLIQELHLACEHLYCQLCDYFLFENPQRIALAMKELRVE